MCQVDVGDAEPAHIVCGAPNVAAGQTVAVARPGAIMPDGTRLKQAKLRGEPSQRREGKFHRDKAEVVREVVDAAQNWPPEGPATDLEAAEWGRVETIERKG